MSSKIVVGEKKIIVSFSGQGGSDMGSIPRLEFVNFLEKHYNQYERHFYLDDYNKWYHCGIGGISTNVDTTVEYLKEKIKNFDEVIFIGSSAGGYAAILFGSLLNIEKVIAFRPQTTVELQEGIDDKYINLKEYINKTTKYYIYGDIAIDIEKDPLHHVSHCERINISPNVYVNTSYTIDLKMLRDNGELLKIMKLAILPEE
jgi:hypothetical protein